MSQGLTRICICSGNRELDISRAEAAIVFREELKKKVPIRILGAGPDLRTALSYYDLFSKNGISKETCLGTLNTLDHHVELYNFVLEKTGEKPEVVTKSVTLVQNVLYGFTGFKEGNFAIVTEPWHYQKFEYIQESLKKGGKIPGDLKFFNVPSPDTGDYTRVQKLLSNIKSRAELMIIRLRKTS
jgi:hypothetical protein